MKAVSAVATAFIFASLNTAFAAGPSFVLDGTMTICTTAAFPPMTFKETEADTRPIGIDIEIADALAKLWGAKTSYTTTEFSGLLPSLGSGRCGLIVSGIYVNDERRKTYDAARYMKSATVLVTKVDNSEISDPSELSGKTVALETGTYYREERIDPLNKDFDAAGKAEVTVQNYPAQQAAYQQVMVGRADATLTEEAEGAYRVATTANQFKIAYTWQSDFTYGIYIRRNPTDLAEVRSSLKRLKGDGFFNELAKKYGLNPSVFDVDYDN